MDTDFSICFLNHFPTLSMFFLLFVFVVCVWDTTSHGGRAINSGQSIREEEFLKTVCLLPTALVGAPYQGEKSILGNPAKMVLQMEASSFGGYFKYPQKCIPPPTAECGRVVANICTIFTCTCCTESFWEG